MAAMFVLLLRLQVLLVVVVVGLNITSMCTTTTTTASAFGAPLLPRSTSTASICKESERRALVEFKKHFFKDPGNKLSSWEGQDCCSWEGVRCDNRTGNIVGLDLQCHHYPYELLCLEGEISPSLLCLQHLTHIDFGGNDFYGARFPSFISQFKEFRYLNLSGTYFMGSIPTSLGNLSNLQTLDLSYNYFLDPDSSDHQWLSHLTSLQHFVANDVNFGYSSSSLFLALNKLPSIKEIRLSGCKLETIPLSIPHLNLSSLAILDLSYNNNNFSGCSWVFNLKTLEFLDLSYNYFDPCNESSDHPWLSHLTSLQHFVANGVNFSYSSTSLFLALNKLPSIKEIRMSGCELETIPHSIPNLNFSSLAILDLSFNYINFSGCSWVFNIKTLEYLDLRYNHYSHPKFTTNTSVPSNSPFTSFFIKNNENYKDEYSKISISESISSLCSLETLNLSGLNIITQTMVELGAVFSGCLMDSLTHLHLRKAHLEGDIPDWMGDIKNLKVLDLSLNSLSGSVPSSLARLSYLEELDLSSNKLNGTLPKEIGELEELVYLNLSGNQLTGVVSEAHFAVLKKLENLDLYGNSLVFNVSSNWVPPFLLKELSIRYCSVGPGFPKWLQKQHKLNSLDMSYTGITGTIPDWFWKLITTHNLTSVLLLSHNQIEGMMPKSLNFINMDELDLSSNRFYGPLPDQFHSSWRHFTIDLSNNSFSGPIPPGMIENISDHTYLEIYLSRNQLNGSVPSWLCQRKGLLSFVDISQNNLSGELPDCGVNSSTALNLNLAYNNIFGSIPPSICSVTRLESLQLNHNKLSGKFPLSLKNCSRLFVLDLSHNNFTGSIPLWVGGNLSSLLVLNLRSNNFIDQIPQEISQLNYLQILDLSNNNLSSPIPTSLGNLTAMLMPPKVNDWMPDVLAQREAMSLSFKGRQDDYYYWNLPFVKFIDLSNNELSRLIPEELANLYGLQSLNLSRNKLEDEIPNKLGRLKQLESLDLSRTKLSGSIPSTFSNLTFISHFNVSHNNLSGRIPSGNQFDTFIDPSIYIGNHLCGSPLIEKCAKDGGTSQKGPSDQENEDSEEDNEMIWLYIGSLSGFAVGFWTVWGVLVFKKKWRHAYFHCIDNISNNINVYAVVSFRRMKKKMMPNF